MKKYILALLVLCLPVYAFAQNSNDSPSPAGNLPSPAGDPSSAKSNALEPAVPVAAPVKKYRPRPMRKIENREFSNRDKIMLLLSAHCDFPTKEDLISTISFDKMLEDEEQMAADASFTRRKKQSESTNSDDAETPEVSERADNVKSPSTPKESADARKLTPEEKARVETYLQNILYTILKDDSVLLTVRGRSLEALAYFNTEKNVKMLTYALTHSERIKRPIMLVQAIRAFPEVAPDKAAEILAPFLEHENDMVRFVTIRTLQKTPGDAAVQVMQKRLDAETNRFFKARLMESIQCHDEKLPNCR